MNNLEQEVDIDYYKVLGVNRNCSVQDICIQYLFIYSAIEISHLIIIPHFNIKIPIKLIKLSHMLHKHSMSSMIVFSSTFS